MPAPGSPSAAKLPHCMELALSLLAPPQAGASRISLHSPPKWICSWSSFLPAVLTTSGRSPVSGAAEAESPCLPRPCASAFAAMRRRSASSRSAADKTAPPLSARPRFLATRSACASSERRRWELRSSSLICARLLPSASSARCAGPRTPPFLCPSARTSWSPRCSG